MFPHEGFQAIIDPMKRTLGIFTTTRAEFGLLHPLMEAIKADRRLDFRLFAGGAHLSRQHGHTVDEIHQSGIHPAALFDFVKGGDSRRNIAASLARATESLINIFETEPFDYVCFIGDRYEMMAVVMNAIIYRKPIIHIHGGERSEGAIDEQLRHMYTKASHLHFAACETYAKNIIRMGESAERVFNSGALGIDNIVNLPLLEKREIFETLELDKNRETVLLTYHPGLLYSGNDSGGEMETILKALDDHPLQVVITAPNIEHGSDSILKTIILWCESHADFSFHKSLGFKRYLSLVRQCSFVIGNSSSGIIEVPFFRIPTINIGSRQQGRIRHESVIDCPLTREAINECITLALSASFRAQIKQMQYIFGDGAAAKNIVNVIGGISKPDSLLEKRLTFPIE